MSEATQSTRKGKLPSIVFLVVLALIVASIGLTLAMRSGLRLPSISAARPKSAPATATPSSTSHVTELALPTAPAKPTQTPIPTLLPLQIVVEGVEQYPGTLPYVAEYVIVLSRGESASVSVACAGCLWQDGAPKLELASGAASKGTFRAVVLAGATANFNLVVNGSECIAWKLTQGQTKSFRGVCAPGR